MCCWRNRLKHGNEQAKEYLKNHPELDGFRVHGENEVKTPDPTPLHIEFDQKDSIKNILIKIQDQLKEDLREASLYLDKEDLREEERKLR